MAGTDQIYTLGSTIPLTAFQATIGTFFALSILTLSLTLLTRIIRRNVSWAQDSFLLLTAASLVSATALAYAGAGSFYFGSALLRYPSLILDIPLDSYDPLPGSGRSWYLAFEVLAWTAVFSSKAVLLALLRRCSSVRWFSRYYYAVLACNVAAWALLVAAVFVLDPFDELEIDNSASLVDALSISVSSLVAAIDIATSLLIAILLAFTHRHASPTTPGTKPVTVTGLLLTLCLITTTFAILRTCMVDYAHDIDLVWGLFWHHLEASVALIIASVATFGAACLVPRSRLHQQQHQHHAEKLPDRYDQTTPDTAADADAANGRIAAKGADSTSASASASSSAEGFEGCGGEDNAV